MPTETDFDEPVVTEHTVEVRFRITGERFVFEKFGKSLSPAPPLVERDPLRTAPCPNRFPRWELNWLARKLAEAAVSSTV
jgi:hypothetical protein